MLSSLAPSVQSVPPMRPISSTSSAAQRVRSDVALERRGGAGVLAGAGIPACLSGWPSATPPRSPGAPLAGFFILTHVFDGPLRYGASTRFETMPSSPMRQTCSNTVGPSPVRCSLNRMARRLALPISLTSRRLRSIQRQIAQVVAVMLDQVEREQHRLMTPALGAQRMEVRRPVLAGDHGLAIDRERRGLDASGTSTMAGKRSAQSWPLCVKQRTRAPSRRTISR